MAGQSRMSTSLGLHDRIAHPSSQCLLKLNVMVEFGEQVYFSSDEVSSFCFLFCCWRAMCCSSCELTNIIITVEKEECGLCKSINTTWCAGYCCTQDLVYKDPARPNIQKTCTFKELVYETVKVPGCAHHADSLYTYPVASECHCGKCDSDSTDCTVRGLGPSYCSFSEIKE
ncbi:follitropin subunit beta-like [Balaenoptera musculus]|uniref:Follitropin subunit beta n=1 Tax=Balaenoptera musculus TaxID=9771 RepID=A0A8B8Y4L9_BALMU|nr:follitropin subunit beta-like [Balaenoptera musculus]